jgi:hypothetical protein
MARQHGGASDGGESAKCVTSRAGFAPDEKERGGVA